MKGRNEKGQFVKGSIWNTKSNSGSFKKGHKPLFRGVTSSSFKEGHTAWHKGKQIVLITEKEIICKNCGNEIKKNGFNQKYCFECKKRGRIGRLARLIPLKENCEICGSIEKRERHHWDYSKPLLITTLCMVCHKIQHIKNFKESKYAYS